VGGVLVTGANYGVLAWFMIAGGLVSLALLIPVVRFADAGPAESSIARGSAELRGVATKAEPS
jgi:hypothetical protein